MESSGRTLVCSVLFLDIVEYSKKPVAEQLQLKQAFNKTLAAALEQVAVRDRIILDTGDGAAVTFMGDPEDALFAAMTVRDGVADVPVRLGINLGPVRLVKDLNGQMNIIGDGINVAQRVMSFSSPGQLMVSRSFYEVVSCLSRDYANLFRHEGARTDKHVREHDVYSVVGGAPALRSPASRTQPGVSRAAWLARPGPLGLRRSALVAAPIAFLVAAVAGGVAARAMMRPAAPTSVAAVMGSPSTPAAPAPAATPEPAAAAPAPKAAESQKPMEALFPKTPAAGPKAVARLEKKPPPRPAASQKAGRLAFVVLPWGEVLIDGKSRGVSPPVRELEIPAGPHTIEIRNTTFPAFKDRVEVKAGETTRIRHRFR